eukprot:224682-Prymnesium_polylepis.1
MGRWREGPTLSQSFFWSMTTTYCGQASNHRQTIIRQSSGDHQTSIKPPSDKQSDGHRSSNHQAISSIHAAGTRYPNTSMAHITLTWHASPQHSTHRPSYGTHRPIPHGTPPASRTRARASREASRPCRP